jgi:glycosyltransferase involved in cell wall biosynthesis
MLRHAYQQADRIVVLSRDMREKCLNWGLPDEKITIIPNWADTTQIRPEKARNEFRTRHGLDDKFVVMYSGNLGYAHQLEPLLLAAAQLQSRPEIQFVMVGEGVQKARLERMAGELNLSNIRFLPYQAREELSQSLSAADVHFLSMHPHMADCLMPSKLYGILASGTPIVAACPSQSELADIIQDFDVGIVCDAGEPCRNSYDKQLGKRLADAIAHFADHPEKAERMGVAARLLAVEKYDRKIQTALFAELLDEVLASQTQTSDDTVTVSLDAEETLESARRPFQAPRRKRSDPSLSDPFLTVPR